MLNLPRRQFLHLAAGAAALLAFSRVARAQSYPARAVRLIVPFAPGGQTDAIARLLAQRLSETSGKQFYVENVPGAGGNIGMGRAAHAMADGYTLLVVDQINFAVNPSLYNRVPYDPAKDFDPIAFAASTTQVLTVTPSLPVQGVSDLVRLIKGDPGKYSYASAGVGSPSHLTSELDWLHSRTCRPWRRPVSRTSCAMRASGYWRPPAFQRRSLRCSAARSLRSSCCRT